MSTPIDFEDSRTRQLGPTVHAITIEWHDTPFAAKRKAEEWLASGGRDMVIGSTHRSLPAAIMSNGFWDGGSSKWPNIYIETMPLLTGYMTGDVRHGPIHIHLRADLEG